MKQRQLVHAMLAHTARSALVVWLFLAVLPIINGCSGAPTPTATATVQPTPRPRQSYLATDTPAAPPIVTELANLRAGPGTEYERVGSAEAGEVMALVGRNAAGWRRVW
jgi:hypothetical protein